MNTEITLNNRTPYGSAKVNNEAAGLYFFRCSNLKSAQGLSFSNSIALKMQNSTACDWFANEWFSIFDINQSKATGSTVTFRRFLRVPFGKRGIQCQFMPNNLNIDKLVCQTSANNALGLSNHENRYSISDSAGRTDEVHCDHRTERGNHSAGQDDPGSNPFRPGGNPGRRVVLFCGTGKQNNGNPRGVTA